MNGLKKVQQIPVLVWADCGWCPAVHGYDFHRAAAGPWAGSDADTAGGAVPSLRPEPGSRCCTAADGPPPGLAALQDPESPDFSAPAGGNERKSDINTKMWQIIFIL